MFHSLQYAYRDRRNRKRDMRTLWITRINAGARLYGMSYRDLIHGLKLANVSRGPQDYGRHGRPRPQGVWRDR